MKYFPTITISCSFRLYEIFQPVNNLPGIWNDPYRVAADNDVDDVDVDSGEGHFPLSQSSLKLYFPLFYSTIFFGYFGEC